MWITWLQPLKRLAEDKRLVIIRFDESEWQSLKYLIKPREHRADCTLQCVKAGARFLRIRGRNEFALRGKSRVPSPI